MASVIPAAPGNHHLGAGHSHNSSSGMSQTELMERFAMVAAAGFCLVIASGNGDIIHINKVKTN